MSKHHALKFLAPLAVLALAASCSDEQKRDLGEVDVRDSLTASVEQTLGDHDAAVDGDGLDCTSSISEDGAVAGSCEGTMESGDAVTGTYAGTANVDDETCRADLEVTVGGSVLDSESDVDCFSS
jgi:hypothetical protein